MNAPEQDPKPTGVNHVLGAPGADEVRTGAKRVWSAPSVTTFKVTDTKGIFFGSSDGINNLTNEG
jgi:hypothetical protein